MASEIAGLFMSPEQYQMLQDQAMQKQAGLFAQMNPLEQVAYSQYRGGQQLGGLIGRALGGQDPQLRLISQRQQLSQGLDMTDPQQIMATAQRAAQLGDTQYASALAEIARQAAQEIAKTRAQTAVAAKNELTVQQEEKLRDELAKLGPNPSQEEVIAVVSKYGSPERVLAAMTTAATTRESIAARKDIAEQNRLEREQATKDRAIQRERELEIAHQNRLDVLRQQGADRAALERERQEYKREQADEKKRQEEEKKENKTLTAGLQMKEDEDLKLVDNYAAQQKTLSPAISALTLDPKTGKRLLELGPLKNRKYELQNASGRSTTESRAYESLQSAIKTAVNIQTDAAKGVQTDRDVLRFAEALIAAYGKNDTEATLQALQRFNAAAKDAEVKTKQIIESRRKSQGVKPYFGDGAPAAAPQKRVKFSDLNP